MHALLFQDTPLVVVEVSVCWSACMATAIKHRRAVPTSAGQRTALFHHFTTLCCLLSQRHIRLNCHTRTRPRRYGDQNSEFEIELKGGGNKLIGLVGILADMAKAQIEGFHLLFQDKGVDKKSEKAAQERRGLFTPECLCRDGVPGQCPPRTLHGFEHDGRTLNYWSGRLDRSHPTVARWRAELVQGGFAASVLDNRTFLLCGYCTSLETKGGPSMEGHLKTCAHKRAYTLLRKLIGLLGSSVTHNDRACSFLCVPTAF